MTNPNPFKGRQSAASGPATDMLPVTPSDTVDLACPAIGLYVETGGTLAIVTARGAGRSLRVDDFSILPVGVLRVRATGTSATGIHALVLG